MDESTISKMHNGLIGVPFFEAARLMPEISETLFSLDAEKPLSEYVIDVKVHMLMKDQYPCIPNWHFDMIPRVNGKQDFSKTTSDKMYLWISGPPITEFENKPVVVGEWNSFTQADKHRGHKASEYCWRLFIRACPLSILQPKPKDQWIRRHSQVYLDADNFTW